jgi:hypothetical protein
MRARWLIGSLLLALVLAGCIVVPVSPVAVGRPHFHRHGFHGHHHGYYRHGFYR